jgi:hypothetical protein
MLGIYRFKILLHNTIRKINKKEQLSRLEALTF